MNDLDRLLARDAIRDACTRYMRGLDTLDASLQMSAFHDDAVVDFGFFAGAAERFVLFAQGVVSRYSKTFHVIAQSSIVFAPDGSAGGDVAFIAWHRKDDEGRSDDLMIAGRYLDSYAYRSGRWAIASRIEVVEWTATSPASDDWITRTPQAILGGRQPLPERIIDDGRFYVGERHAER